MESVFIEFVLSLVFVAFEPDIQSL